MSHTTEHLSLPTLWNIGAPLHVLVIETSQAEAELSLVELRRAGFHCEPLVIGTRAELLENLLRFPFDLVISDYKLQGWDGMDAFTLLRQSGREVPFILVTGKLREEEAVECIRSGVTDCVFKSHLARLPFVVARSLEEKALRDARNLMTETHRQSEANSLILFAHNPFPMWVLERESLQILQVNDAAILHYGYDRLEFLRMQAGDLHPIEEVPQLLGAFQQGFSAEQQARQWHHRRKDGSMLDVEMFLQDMEYSGSPAALVVAQDITKRKRAEAERQKFFTLVENSRDFIAVADLNDNVEYLNPAGREMLGIPSAEPVAGTHSLDYIIPDDLPLVYNTILPALKNTGHWEGELRFRHRQTGQALPMDFVGFQVQDPETGQARYVATVSRDVTERRALEQQLRHAQKFEAIGQLAGGIAHDFNNVIGAIQGWAELGEEQAAATSDPLQTYFEKIHVQCDRVTALIWQLLAFARRQILEPRNFVLNQTVQDVLNLLDNVIGKDIEIKTVLAEDLVAVRADPTQVEQVLMNLCINSRDAMPKGGLLTIETCNAEFSEKQCRAVPGLQPGRYAELSVRDNGMGMDAAVRDRIFEPFFTTKGTGKGTGLGLATVFGIVKQHGGYILVESESGSGSKFRVLLPASEKGGKSVYQHPVQEDDPVRGGPETILIAEDHEGIREMAQAALTKLGYEILIAKDGEEAVAMFSRHCKDISLVLLDVIMPRMSGPQAYAAITSIRPGVSAIFATGYSNELGALAEIADRGVTILRKPYSPAALCRRIREVLDFANGGLRH